MTRVLEYLHARLQEPGTLRSLVVVIVGVQQGASADTMVDAITSLALVALGVFSALKPETPPK
jgi:hypothetical protein